MTRVVFDGDTCPAAHPMWQTYFQQQKDTPMIAPVPDHRLIDDLTAQIGVVEELPHHCERDAESVATELGWLKCLAHVAKRGGLTHAGKEEARKIVSASKDWVREYLGEEAGRER